MDKTWVKDVKEGEHAKSVFLVSRKAVPTAKSGKPYLSVTLQDKTGELEARAFERVEEFAHLFEEKDYVEVDGQVGTFQGKPQLRIEQVTKVEAASIDPAEFVWVPPPEPKKPEKSGYSEQEETAWRELAALVDAVSDPHVKGLIRAFLEDDDIAGRLRRAPAAKTVHHAYPGGLLEHTVSCLKLAHRLADHYPQIDRDLLVAGAFFHDLGKIRELTFDRQVEYSDEGRLVGHLVMTAQWIHDKARRVGIPRDLEQHIVHLVLSHHGKLEFGSPKLPMTLEAVLTHEIDEVDSRVNSWLNLMGRDGGTRRWTDANNIYEQHIWRGTLPTVQVEKKGPPAEVMTPVIYIPRDAAAQQTRAQPPGAQKRKRPERTERKHEAPREAREPREASPEGAPAAAAEGAKADAQPRPERSERPERAPERAEHGGDRPPRGERRPERGDRGGGFRGGPGGPGGPGDRKRGYTGPRLPGDRGPQPRPKASPTLTHNPFAALAQKIEGAGEARASGPGEGPSAPEAEAAAAHDAAPPAPGSAPAAAPDTQAPPARHEAEPGSAILADAGVGRTVPPSDAEVGSGDRTEGGASGGTPPGGSTPGTGEGEA